MTSENAPHGNGTKTGQCILIIANALKNTKSKSSIVKLIKYAKGDFRFYLNMLLHVVPLKSRYLPMSI